MRIISDYHDFYDVGKQWDQEQYPVWVRREVDPLEVVRAELYFTTKFNFYVYGFAGETHLMIPKYEKDDIYQQCPIYLWGDDAMDQIRLQFLIELKFSESWYSRRLFERVANLDLNWIFEKEKTPIFGLRLGCRRAVLDLSPIFKDVAFQKIYDPFTAYQKVSQYYGTFMISRDTPQEISDQDMAKKKGFGDKYDFRRPPK